MESHSCESLVASTATGGWTISMTQVFRGTPGNRYPGLRTRGVEIRLQEAPAELNQEKEDVSFLIRA